ncbi:MULTISPECIES: hypothetical protein [unclassified Shewanella]|uniref:hypothetical protein n=1 Tax=unclassified Shewanella TaxID=196818 RepID=UPI000C8673A9|nr:MULTISPECIES: hypothetical protein [unclassified Shewanella]MDO6618736.1 hypothetical protein [Shewanella sp. 6_MG-2023]MDO6639821.1 hypothetical protein [Shewanella sp. 5_MG-2023]MDO6678628.1 hypothetical protein [Shewanella sp. 4_MG-2023]MDO6775484.1 hypothetical protein [Shewanella sp. 3_MG-2023]PMG31861.1 hypothetical protein BCU94_06705 [Shewanella sp. 10N.286.52.C2]
MKKSTLSIITAAGLLLSSSAVMANAIETSKYKMVLIEDTPGVDAIQSGDISEGIALTEAATATVIDKYTRSLSLCVGYTKLSKFDIAETACTEAVEMANKAAKLPSMQMRAYAYNNRGVMKLMANDNLGALADFKKAAKANHEPIYQHNLSRLEAELSRSETGTL